MADEKKKGKVITPVFRASYCHLINQTQSQDGGKPHWSITMIFEPDEDLTEMKQIVTAAFDKKFGVGNRPGKLKAPFRKGTNDEYDLSKNPEFRDKIICVARAYNAAPGVIDKKTGAKDPSLVYSGCYCVASVVAYFYDVTGNRGVAFGLNNVMKIAEGERLTNQAPVEEDFGDLLDVPVAAGSNPDIFDGL